MLLLILYVYVSALPPLSVGGVNVTTTREAPAVRVSPVMSSGFFRGVAVSDELAVPAPAALTTLTLKV